MFDKKEMKLINFEKAKKYLMNGVQVYMVNLDGSLIEINEDTDWKSIVFHNLKGGSYAVYKKKFTGIGTFSKDIHIGKWDFTVSHTKKGVMPNVLLGRTVIKTRNARALYRELQSVHVSMCSDCNRWSVRWL